MKSFQVAGDGRVFGIFPSESKARSYRAELSGKGIRARIRVVQDESTKGRARAGELDISSKRSLDATLDWIRDEVGGGCNLTAFAKSDRGCYRLRYEMRPAAKGIRWKTELSRDGSVLGRASDEAAACNPGQIERMCRESLAQMLIDRDKRIRPASPSDYRRLEPESLFNHGATYASDRGIYWRPVADGRACARVKTPEGVFCGLVGPGVAGFQLGAMVYRCNRISADPSKNEVWSAPLDVSYSRSIEMRNGIAMAEKELARISRTFDNLEVPGAGR